MRWLAPVAGVVLLGGCVSVAQRAPRVVPWSPPGVSSNQYESHPAVDPATGDFYFVRSKPDFSGWRILVARCAPDGWAAPVEPSFSAPGVEADPFITADGKSLYFISTRATASAKSQDLDLYRADRAADGAWQAPVRLPSPVNSNAAEWFPRPGPDGWLYFGSNRAGGEGGNDIWRARQTKAGAWQVENAGRAINTPGNEYEPLPSPDGKHLLIEADDGLYISQRTKAGWGPRQKLGPDINVNGTEIGAAYSPDGRVLLFSRDTKGENSGELFLWTSSWRQEWPPDCQADVQLNSPASGTGPDHRR